MIGDAVDALLADALVELQRRREREHYLRLRAVSDALLREVEQRNLRAASRFEYPPHEMFATVRISERLSQRIVEFAGEVGLVIQPSRRSMTALEQLFAVQQALFLAGNPLARELAAEEGYCIVCGTEVPPPSAGAGRHRTYCSDKCAGVRQADAARLCARCRGPMNSRTVHDVCSRCRRKCACGRSMTNGYAMCATCRREQREKDAMDERARRRIELRAG